MSFDEIIDRRGTHCVKWDMVEPLYGVSPEDGLAMWVADMDFRAPDCVTDALRGMIDHGVYGYFGDDRAYKTAICDWMQARHGWTVDPDWILSASGLVNGTAICVETFTQPGDGVILFTPVYHAFHKVLRAGGREIVECELANRDGRYEMDFDAYEAQMTGREKMVILCSPHNPGGRVWSRAELRQLADFARRHDLIVVSDEIHHDLVFPGHTHTPMAVAAPEIADRLVMMSASTKTFNIAGAHTGNIIVEDAGLRAKLSERIMALGVSPASFGVVMATAAYAGGADWLEELIGYLDENRRILDDGVNAIPGLASMPREATYLSWVDFSGTGMAREDFTRRVERDARIAANHGPTFGTGGDSFLRFNIATQRSRVEDAVARLQQAFGDLQ